MAVDWNSMLMDPVARGLSPTGDNSMEIQRLKLAQDQFENLKKNEQDSREWNRIEEAGRNARAQMVDQREIQRQQAEEQQRQRTAQAAITAENLKNKTLAYQKFTELNGSGKVDEARAMVPMMTSLGMSVDLLGDQGGLPAYRVHMSPGEARAAAQQSQPNGIGYPTNDSEPMTAPPGIGSTEEAFSRAQAATPALSQADTGGTVVSDATDLPVDTNQGTMEAGSTSMPAARSPDAPDLTGGVPNDVIDTGAQHALTLQRLNPGLQAFVQSYPQEYQDSARHTAEGVAGLGLPLTESIKAWQDARQGVDPRIQEQLSQEAQGGRAATAASATAAQHAVENHQTGFNQAAKIAEEKNIKGYEDNIRNLEQASAQLNGTDRHGDQMAGYAIARMYEKGALSDRDVAAALGIASESVPQRISGWLTGKTTGGLDKTERDALIGVLGRAKAEAESRVQQFLDGTQEQLDNPNLDQNVRNGWKTYRDSIVPKAKRDEYDAAHNLNGRFNMIQDASQRGPSDPGQASPDPVSGAASSAGLNPNAVRAVINIESGGKPDAHNASGATGLIQFMPSIAAKLGTTTEAIGKMTPEEQAPLIAQYFKRAGIKGDEPPEEYYAAVAAGDPKLRGAPDNTVVYRKGTPSWVQNPGWRPQSGGDITLGSIREFARRKMGKVADRPVTSPDDRLAQLLEKASNGTD